MGFYISNSIFCAIVYITMKCLQANYLENNTLYNFTNRLQFALCVFGTLSWFEEPVKLIVSIYVLKKTFHDVFTNCTRAHNVGELISYTDIMKLSV